MPEGDSIHKAATALQTLLGRQILTGVKVRRDAVPSLQNRTVDAIEAVGKHLLIHLSGGDDAWTLRVHLGMHGTWHQYAPRERWKRPAWQASLTLETPTVVAVCFNAREVECLRTHEIAAAGGHIAALGPDLLGSACDLDEVLRRIMLAPAETPAVDILLNQRIAAGIGNVYKNELLFVERVHPLTPRGALDAERWRTLYERARELMARNLDNAWRATTQGEANVGRLYVYRREGGPCYRCKTPILRAVRGARRRSTYWCPTCQPAVVP